MDLFTLNIDFNCLIVASRIQNVGFSHNDDTVI